MLYRQAPADRGRVIRGTSYGAEGRGFEYNRLLSISDWKTPICLFFFFFSVNVHSPSLQLSLNVSVSPCNLSSSEMLNKVVREHNLHPYQEGILKSIKFFFVS